MTRDYSGVIKLRWKANMSFGLIDMDWGPFCFSVKHFPAATFAPYLILPEKQVRRMGDLIHLSPFMTSRGLVGEGQVARVVARNLAWEFRPPLPFFLHGQGDIKC